jgi:hypothetical protein
MKLSHQHNLANNEQGATLIELSISLILFLFMAFGVIEYGSLLNERNAVTQLAREGASLASRGLQADANILDLLEDAENSLKLEDDPTKYRIFLAQITGGDAANNAPTCVVLNRGGLSNDVVAPVPPNCDLPPTLVNYVTYQPGPGGGATALGGFTVVKVYYEHQPLTPFGSLDWFGNNTTGDDGTVMSSMAIY